MKPMNIALIGVVLAIAGTWSKKKTISTRQVVGGIVVIFIFAIAPEDKEIARQFAWLFLASIVGAFGEDLFTVIGDVTTGGKTVESNKNNAFGAGTGTGVSK